MRNVESLQSRFRERCRAVPEDRLRLQGVGTNTLLVHATVDADVPHDHSENGLARLPNDDLIRIEHGTYVSAWTDPDSGAIQTRIADFLASSFG
jgi:pimeloyl-ACP methyl ester carboxylesterase